MAVTKEDKLEMFRMRLEGAKLREIGERYGLTRERVRQILSGRNRRGRPIKSGAYPKLGDWLYANDYTVEEFAQELDMGVQALSNKLNGGRDFLIGEIRMVLKLTGMTFEEAFGQVEDVPGGDLNVGEQQAEGSAL